MHSYKHKPIWKVKMLKDKKAGEIAEAEKGRNQEFKVCVFLNFQSLLEFPGRRPGMQIWLSKNIFCKCSDSKLSSSDFV